MIDSCEILASINEEKLKARDLNAFGEILRDATRQERSTNFAREVQLIFPDRSIPRFIFQRLNDMLVCSQSKTELNERIDDLKGWLFIWRNLGKTMKASSYSYLIPRNMDLVLVESYSTKILADQIENARAHQLDLIKLRRKMYSLGNNAPRRKGIGALIFVLTITCLISIVS